MRRNNAPTANTRWPSSDSSRICSGRSLFSGWVIARASPREGIMASMTETAKAFFIACEAGKGWEGCRAYCAPDASFSAQADPLADVKTLRDYTEWMKGLLTVLTDGRYELISFATDSERNNVAAYGLFVGTHLAN